MKKDKEPLSITHPEFAKEADGWDPTSIFAGTHRKLKWKCSLKHTWEATGKHRLRGQDCPFCANQKVWRGFNDLATTNPELAKEADGWDPTTVIAGTAKICNGNVFEDINGSQLEISVKVELIVPFAQTVKS